MDRSQPRTALLLIGVAAACGAATASRPPPPPAGVPSELQGVVALPNRDSAMLTVPAIAGAADYRAFALPATQTTADDGRETVTGTTIFCAGLEQHNAPATAQPLPARLIDVSGLTGPADVVVEAVDRLCPFPGTIAADHHDLDVTIGEVEAGAKGVFSLFTEAEVIAKYGALIVNGQGPAAKPAQPHPQDPPVVLARTTLHVTPLGNGAPPVATFFDDFSDAADQPVYVKDEPAAPPLHDTQNGQLWQNKKWSIYSYGAHHVDTGAGVIVDDTFKPFIARGQLQLVLADWEQDIFASAIAYPKKLVHPSATSYVHVTFEVPTNATGRRYWQIQLCGADTAGNTMDASGELKGDIIQTAFFFDLDGLDPSAQGWNCFQIFVRDGWPVTLPPDDAYPQSDLRVMVNLPGKLGADVRTSVVNVSPPQLQLQYPGETGIGPPGWYRQQVNGALTKPILDDKMTIAARVHYDLWLRRDRAVLFVDGEQRLCNDFPSVALTMPEAALGFGQVLYHSAAERQGFVTDYWLRTGQLYYLTDAPFVDARGWDNLGFEENVASPPGFDARACYVYAP